MTEKTIQKPTCKILVAYHKLDLLIKDEVYTPIHVGRAIFQQKSKDGVISSVDAQALLSSMIGDDTGENISEDNRFFNEMTALYWAWKNYDMLGNPDFIGLSHYRRCFAFKNEGPLPYRNWLPECPTYMFEGVFENYLKLVDSSYCLKLIQQYDCLTTYEYDTKKQNPKRKYKTLKDRYCELTQLDGTLYDVMKNFIIQNYPSYKEDIEHFEARTDHHLFNMFVMRKDLFFEYCELIFPTLFEIKKHLVKSHLTFSQMRAPGFLAEFITSIFIRHCERLKLAKVKNLDVMFLDNVVATFTELQQEKEVYLKNLQHLGYLKSKYLLSRNENYKDEVLKLKQRIRRFESLVRFLPEKEKPFFYIEREYTKIGSRNKKISLFHKTIWNISKMNSRRH